MRNRFRNRLLLALAADGTTGGAAPDTTLTAPVETDDDTNPTAVTDVTTEDPAAKPKGDDAGNADGDSDPKAPIETYAEFTMPEGMELDSAMLEEAMPLFKELNLTQEQAQKLVDFQSKQAQAGQQGQVDAFNQLKTDWLDQAKADKDIGGDKFNENVATARLALSKFGSEGLTKLMNDYGIGNNPEMIRFMYNVGKLMKEDVPDFGNAPKSSAKDRVDILYPNNSPQK